MVLRVQEAMTLSEPGCGTHDDTGYRGVASCQADDQRASDQESATCHKQCGQTDIRQYHSLQKSFEEVETAHTVGKFVSALLAKTVGRFVSALLAEFQKRKKTPYTP
ncbi:MAG TPA: hypothetical protein VLA11_09625 [Woeseiaceae bacterium]|jgi:hypothetical protein|nr:hypothetical protein [Woeseiaceae bacterium]